jgi:hypothetical protein
LFIANNKQEQCKQGIPDRTHEAYVSHAQTGPDLTGNNRGGRLGASTKQKWNPQFPLNKKNSLYL